MQFDINIMQAQKEADHLEREARKIERALRQVALIYLGLKLVGDPAIQYVVRHVWKQYCALSTERRRLSRMGSSLRTVFRLYYDADEKVAKDYNIRGSVLDTVHNTQRHSTSNEEMQSAVEKYEREHPGEAADLDQILSSGKNNKLTKEDILRIKYLVYTAEEPYRSIYLRYLDNYRIGDGNMKKGAYYSPDDRTINFTYKDCFKKDPRGEYTTFFHESGHGVDDVADAAVRSGFDTDEFRAYNPAMNREVTIREAIEYDVFYNKNNPHSVTSLAQDIIIRGKSGSKGNIDNVIRAFQKGSSSGLNKEDLKLYNAVRNAHLKESRQSPSTQMEAVSDVYGGSSKNALQTRGGQRYGYTHGDGYWNDQNNTNRELWAEYFSYNMAGDTEALNNLREYFPEASKMLDAYARSLTDR